MKQIIKILHCLCLRVQKVNFNSHQTVQKNLIGHLIPIKTGRGGGDGIHNNNMEIGCVLCTAGFWISRILSAGLRIRTHQPDPQNLLTRCSLSILMDKIYTKSKNIYIQYTFFWEQIKTVHFIRPRVFLRAGSQYDFFSRVGCMYVCMYVFGVWNKFIDIYVIV